MWSHRRVLYRPPQGLGSITTIVRWIFLLLLTWSGLHSWKTFVRFARPAGPVAATVKIALNAARTLAEQAGAEPPAAEASLVTTCEYRPGIRYELHVLAVRNKPARASSHSGIDSPIRYKLPLILPLRTCQYVSLLYSGRMPWNARIGALAAIAPANWAGYLIRAHAASCRTR